VRKGDFVCRVGGPPDNWYGVVDGLVKMSMSTPDGNEVIFLVVPTGGWFGEGTLLKNERRRYDIVALRNTRMAVMPRATFIWLVDNSPTFDRFLLDQLNARLGQILTSLSVARSRSAVVRVAHSLAALFHPSLYPGANQTIRLSQEEIGHLAGISRQRANEALHLLEHEDFVEISYGNVTVLDIDGLQEYDGQKRTRR
jgi:CRP-like cAMP-binding protein